MKLDSAKVKKIVQYKQKKFDNESIAELHGISTSYVSQLFEAYNRLESKNEQALMEYYCKRPAATRQVCLAYGYNLDELVNEYIKNPEQKKEPKQEPKQEPEQKPEQEQLAIVEPAPVIDYTVKLDSLINMLQFQIKQQAQYQQAMMDAIVHLEKCVNASDDVLYNLIEKMYHLLDRKLR